MRALLREYRARQKQAREDATNIEAIVTRPSVVTTRLSAREQRLLRQKTEPLFIAGKVDLRFMGMHFLELHHLHLTPEFLQYDRVTRGMSPERREQWVNQQFERIFDWWSGLSPAQRDDIIAASRFCRKTDEYCLKRKRQRSRD